MWMYLTEISHGLNATDELMREDPNWGQFPPDPNKVKFRGWRWFPRDGYPY